MGLIAMVKEQFLPSGYKNREFIINLKQRHKSYTDVLDVDGYQNEIYYSTALYESPTNPVMADKKSYAREFTIDIDVDGDFLKAKKEMIIAVNALNKIGIFCMAPTIVFSGSKGFHLHVVNDRLMKINKEAREKIGQYLIHEGVEHLDMTVIIDGARIIRLPFSVNKKSGLICTPMNYIIFKSWDGDTSIFKPEKVIPKDTNYSNTWYTLDEDKLCNFLSMSKEEYEKKKEFKEIQHVKREVTIMSKNLMSMLDVFPKCIQRMMVKANKTGELTHAERFELAIFFSNIGCSDELIIEFFSGTKNYSEYYTKLQLNNIFTKDYISFCCYNMHEKGLCDVRCETAKQIENCSPIAVYKTEKLIKKK